MSRGVAANAERSRLGEELASIGKRAGAELVGGLEEEGVQLEAEVNRLQERKRELKAEIEKLSRRHDEVILKQKAHMTQVDCWRLDKEKVKESTVKSKDETKREEESTRREEASCSDLLARVREATSSVRQVAGAAEGEAMNAIARADEHVASSASSVVLATEARLSSALSAAREVHAEHRRAKSTLELLEVSAPQSDLPTRGELARALALLRDAWAARATLGSVGLGRRGEVESFLREAADDMPDTLAEAKATWAQRWGDLGDLAATLADAAAGGSGGGGGGGAQVAAREAAPAPAASIRAPVAAAVPATAAAAAAPSPQQLPSLDDEEPLLAAG